MFDTIEILFFTFYYLGLAQKLTNFVFYCVVHGYMF